MNKLSTKSKFGFIGAFAALLTLALASCQGFFPPATLQTIALQPTDPTFAVGYQQAMQAWGTDSNNNRFQITSNVVWSLSDPSSGTVATINTNNGTMTGVNAGTITVTASSEGLSGTATATVVQQVTSMTITPQNASVEDTGTAYQAFTITDQSGNNISSLVTLQPYQGSSQVSGIVCGYESQAVDGMQDCTPNPDLVTVSTTYAIVVTYSGYTGTATVEAQLTVNPD